MEALIERVQALSPRPLRGVRIVCVQHLLQTTGSLLESFVRLGCEPGNIHVLGKFYSTNKTVEHKLKDSFDVIDWRGDIPPGHYSTSIRKNIARLWSRVEARSRRTDQALIVLDDGGRCRQFFPSALSDRHPIAVEQTTSGLKWRRGGRWMSTIEVAGSAAKKTLESPAVTASIMRYVLPQLTYPTWGGAVGVVGLGTVGQDLAIRLASLGHEVNVYDKSSRPRDWMLRLRWCDSLMELFKASNVVLGCTGEDLLAHADWLHKLQGNRILASCSSEDIEFRSVLRRIRDSSAALNPLSAREVCLPNGSLTILRGGFPANFTGTPNSGPPDLIQVTRALLLAGVVQAAAASRSSVEMPRRIMLDPSAQALVSHEFLTARRGRLFRTQMQQGHALDVAWLAANSTGIRMATEIEASREE
jgi:S-adenosylhomocysteine hydrolase